MVFDPQTKNPKYPSFESATTAMVSRYLTDRNLLQPDEHVVSLEPSDRGAAARNETIRVFTDQRSLILKQFREWPANGRVPPAASDRFRAECQFYRTARIAGCSDRALPVVAHQDAQTSCVVLTDIGPGLAPSRGAVSPAEAESLVSFLISLHHRSQSVPQSARYRNDAVLGWQMTRLFTRAAPGDRSHGYWLARFARSGDGVSYALEDALGALEKGDTSLVHGDFCLKNWVLSGPAITPRVVDGEFSFFGPAEFDAGTMLASLIYSRQPRETVAAAVRLIGAGCFRYRPRLVVAYAAAQLCSWFEDSSPGAPIWRGQVASGVLRRAARAIESDTIEPLVPVG